MEEFFEEGSLFLPSSSALNYTVIHYIVKGILCIHITFHYPFTLKLHLIIVSS